MNDLIEFLTSKEIIVVYIVAAIACFLCFIVYIIDKNYYKRKRRHNTRELNKLVMEVNEQLEEEGFEEAPQEVYETPVLESIEVSHIEEMPATTVTPVVEEQLTEPVTMVVEETIFVPEQMEVKEDNSKIEDIILENMTQPEEKVEEITKEEIEEVIEEELTYTDIEPNKEEAQAELQRLTEELKKAEQEVKNIDLTAYEEEQEENAIISLEELVRKSKQMYEQNELTQYADEGNEPISLADLEIKLKEYATPVPTTVESIVEEIEALEEPVIIKTLEPEPAPIVIEQQKLVLDDFNSVKVEPVVEEKKTTKEAYKSVGTFKSSPVISPIYGIEPPKTELELENTANYEKLDAEIKKTNDFLMTLKELHNHLD